MTRNIKLVQGGKTVTLLTTSVSEDSVNPLIIISIPSTDLVKITKAVNLLKILRRWEVDGVLADDVYPGTVKASTKRTDLVEMFRLGNPVVFTYAGINYNIGMEKLSIKEIATDSVTGDESEPDGTDIKPQSYDVKMTLVEIDLINTG